MYKSRKPIKHKYTVLFADGKSKEVDAQDHIEAEHLAALARKRLNEPTGVLQVTSSLNSKV
jgi:hypothetical protein